MTPPGKTGDVPLGSLSGGERSYVAVCFICSLWVCMQTPFKFLDEFDVFMDVKHRELAINLLYSLGNKSTCNQMFLLTPNDVKSKEVLKDFKVENCSIFTLKDPERGNVRD